MEVAAHKLRPRPNGPTREEVHRDQRARLCAAMVEAVAAHGYSATTAREVTGLAKVSTRTLYERFDGKHECFLATFDGIVDSTVQRVLLAQQGEPDWRPRLRQAFAALMRQIADEPKKARLALVETLGAGPLALERVERAGARFEEMVRVSFEQAPGNVPVTPLVVKGIVAGVAGVARMRLLDDRSGELPELADELLGWALACHSPAVAKLQELLPVLPSGQPMAVVGVAADGRRRVGESVRVCILEGTARVAAKRGYAQLTPEAIASAAGVRKCSLRSQVGDVDDCFMASLEMLSDRALCLAVQASVDGGDWAGGVYRAVQALIRHIADDPVFAGMAFVEIFELGPAVLACRKHLTSNLIAGFRAGMPDDPRPSDLVLEASVAAVWGVIHHQVVHGHAKSLPSLAEHLAYVLLAPILGAEAAVESITAEHARIRAGSRGR